MKCSPFQDMIPQNVLPAALITTLNETDAFAIEEAISELQTLPDNVSHAVAEQFVGVRGRRRPFFGPPILFRD